MPDTKSPDNYPPAGNPARVTSVRGSQASQGVVSRGVIDTNSSRHPTGAAVMQTPSQPTPPGAVNQGTGRAATPAYPLPAVKSAGTAAPAASPQPRTMTPAGTVASPSPYPGEQPRAAQSGRITTPTNQPVAVGAVGVQTINMSPPVRSASTSGHEPAVQQPRDQEVSRRGTAQAYPVAPAMENQAGAAPEVGPRTLLLDGSMLEEVRARAAATAAALRSATPPAPASAVTPQNAAPVAPIAPVRIKPSAVGTANRSPVPTQPDPPVVQAVVNQVPPAKMDATQFALSKKADAHLPMLIEGSTERAAAFRALRRRLAEQKDPRIILVTSALDDEGKTTTAANLALAMAESGRLRVLLVEANMRRPKLASIFGFQPVRCLRTQLEAHRADIDTKWQTTLLQPIGLQVLAAAPDTSTDEPLHGPTFGASVMRWRAAFDYVVVDGPSILESCDASIIHDSMDAVLMVVRSGVSSNRVVRRALDQISADMVAGIVLMDSPLK